MDETRAREGRHLLDYWAVVHRWRYLIAAAALLSTSVAAARAFTTRPMYRATAQIQIGRSAPQVLEFKEVTQLDAQSWGDEYHLTQLKLLGSRTVAERAAAKLGLAAGDPEFDGTGAARLVDAFRGRVNARRLEHSQLFAVSFDAHQPEFAARAANAVAEVFIDEAVRARAETIGQATTWLGAQIEDQRRKVQAAEEDLQRFTEQAGIVSFEDRRMLLDQRLKQLGGHLTDAKSRRLQREGQYGQMRAAANPEDLPTVIDSRVFQEMRIDLSRLQRREAELLAGRYLEQHPEVVKVRAEIQAARRRMAEEAAHLVTAAENDYRVAQAQEQELERALEAAKAEALDLNRRGLRYESLKRDLEASQAVLNSLLARSKQTDVAQELRASPIRIVDAATLPRFPYSPQRSRAVAAGLLLGLAIGIGLAFLLEQLDTRVRTPRDVRAHLGLPLLAVVPEAPAQGQRRALFETAATDAAAEGYRALRAALDHLCAEPESRVVGVVSTAAREGKTFSAVNLALALAARDDDVVLVDADLRRPQADEVLQAKRAPGLTDVLTGAVALDEALQQVGGRLRLLAAGSGAGNAGDLLRPAALKELAAALRQRFRWIVFDTSPLAAVPDALSVAALCDGVVVVLGAEAVRRAAAVQTIARLRGIGARVLGALLNRAPVRRYRYEYGASFGHYTGHEAVEASGGAELAAVK